jgi:hypothetical protein
MQKKRKEEYEGEDTEQERKLKRMLEEMRIQARVVRGRNRLGCNAVCLFEGAPLGKVDTAQSSQSL